jgi:hypothetical protein
MQSLFDVLADKDFDQPAEVKTIKEFVSRHFKSDVRVQLRQKQIVITTPSAALAGSLRTKLHELQKLCGPERKLFIRIGQ